MITTFYPPYNYGGDGIFVEALAKALVGRGHRVCVVHCADSFNLRSRGSELVGSFEETVGGVQVFRLRSGVGRLSPLFTHQTGRPFFKAAALAKILSMGFDVLHFHNISLIGGPGLLAIPAGKALKIWTLHEHWMLCATSIFWKNRSERCTKRECFSCCIRSGIPPQWWRSTGLFRRSLPHLDALIAPSQFTAGQHRDLAGTVPIHVLPHFSRIGTLFEPAFGKPERYFVYAGRITASKGIRELLEVFAEHSEFEIRVAGTGDLLESLRSRFGHLANIRLLGQVHDEELPGLYARACALLMPSLAPETFGLTVIEAMSCGTPAIVRDAGGCREIIDSSGAGYVFQEFSELPAIMRRLAGSEALRLQLGTMARTAYLNSYTMNSHLEGYLDLLSKLRERRSERVEA